MCNCIKCQQPFSCHVFHKIAFVCLCMLLSVRLVFLMKKKIGGTVCAQVAGKVRVLRGVPGALAVAAVFCVLYRC